MKLRLLLTTASLIGLAVAPAASARTIVGGPGPDTLVGTNPNGDLIVGGGGPDTIRAAGGPDRIFGVRSGNRIDAGGGDNYVEGGTGDDKVTAGDGNNTIYTGSGHDSIIVGNGSNYIDSGGAPDEVVAGNGNNVIHAGAGGGTVRAGNGNNVVYSLANEWIELGGGVNQVWLALATHVKHVDCGGNPASVLYVNRGSDRSGKQIRDKMSDGRITRCANVVYFDGYPWTKSQIAGDWQVFNLIGTDGRDKLLGGHAGGRIDGKGGDNVMWADSRQQTGGLNAKYRTTRITAGDGDNMVFGGRGTNIIRLGNGNNFVRGGAWNNDIRVGSGSNTIRIQGDGRNTVTIRGGTAFVESFARRKTARIRCLNGADGTIVHGVRKVKTNCKTVARATSARGKRLTVAGLERIDPSDPVAPVPAVPGRQAGTARPGALLP